MDQAHYIADILIILTAAVIAVPLFNRLGLGSVLCYLIAGAIIIEKLRRFRLGGETSERQLEDVRGVLEVAGPRLDRGYLQPAARRAGVEDLLDELSWAGGHTARVVSTRVPTLGHGTPDGTVRDSRPLPPP